MPLIPLRRSVSLLALLGVLGLSSWVSVANGADDPLPKAKEYFKAGVALLTSGNVTQALDYFQRSRALFPSSQNGLNAALCLDKLGRFDEALELYEEVMTQHRSDLTDEERSTVLLLLAALRKKVGSVEVSSNVGGAVLVDGRERARLPLAAPLRLLPGERRLRVVKDGYVTGEQTVTVQIEGVSRMDFVLRPLEQFGQLRVEVDQVGADVLIDGVSVGSSPFEGGLGSGPHVLWAKHGERGTAPVSVTVIQGRTITVPLTLKPLGEVIRVEVSPETAELSLGDVPLGRGRWVGRLPLGSYTISAAEAGYHRDVRPLSSSETTNSLHIVLKADDAHPRWPRGERNVPWASVFGAWTTGPGFRSGAEADCPSECSGSRTFRGVLAGVRGGYRFPIGLSAELSVGYTSLRSSFDRREKTRFPTNAPAFEVTYSLADDTRVSGPFFAAGASYRRRVGESVSLVARGSVGALLATTSDPVFGTATTGAERVAVSVSGSDQVRSLAPFLSPELSAELSFGGAFAAVGVAMIWLPVSGPRFDRSSLSVRGAACSQPSAVGCAPDSALLAGESAYGSFYALSLGGALGHTF